MSKYSAAFSFLVICLSFPFSTTAQTVTSLPPNTIDCQDWTHNADDTWTAHNDSKPFDFGTKKQTYFHGSTFGPHMVNLDNYDLVDALNQACGRRM
jgi:hypothetical protein